jgi:GntR family transcriptional regulator/MocR family aminotransferase
MAEGHFMRHLRRMKRLYRSRRDALLAQMADLRPVPIGCLAVLIDLPDGALDTTICQSAYEGRIFPTPLSRWFNDRAHARNGLVLCVTNCHSGNRDASVATLRSVLGAGSSPEHRALGCDDRLE